MRHARPVIVVSEHAGGTDGNRVSRCHAGALLVCVALLATAAGGCARARAAELVGPPLAVPMPPPRVVAPPVTSANDRTETPLVGAPEVVQQRATVPAEPPPPVRPRPDPPAASIAPEPSSSPPIGEPPGRVRIESSVDDAARRKEIEGHMSSARASLNRIAPRSLSDRDKAQYEEATNLLAVAQKAMNERNFLYALNQAQKAASLAAALAR